MAIVPDVGLNRVTQLILDNISHTVVGSGTTAEATNDTTLDTETNRLAPTSTRKVANQILVRTFFSNTNLPTTVEEVGWFMNGSGSVDSGELLVRALSSFTKGSQDLNIVLQLTIQRP